MLLLQILLMLILYLGYDLLPTLVSDFVHYVHRVLVCITKTVLTVYILFQEIYEDQSKCKDIHGHIILDPRLEGFPNDFTPSETSLRAKIHVLQFELIQESKEVVDISHVIVTMLKYHFLAGFKEASGDARSSTFHSIVETFTFIFTFTFACAFTFRNVLVLSVVRTYK